MRKLRLLAAPLGLLLLSGFRDPGMGLPKLKRLTVWRAWADSTEQHEQKKWLVSQTNFYPNGELKRQLFLGSAGDTVALSRYALNADSTLKAEMWYNKYLKKWLPDSHYFYHAREKQPYMSKERFDFKRYYTYNDKGLKTGTKTVNEHNQPLFEHEYDYDSLGLMVRDSEFRFFGGQRDDEKREIYVYARNGKGQVVQRDKLYVATQAPGPVVKTDGQGLTKITYYGGTGAPENLLERVFYNDRNEMTRMDEYTERGPKPVFVRTYEYEYYR